ncbi:hypothetical protein BDD12DRAFT_883324 [Trichophaea hybrida]|nr:hypothetical protein BDD12DRAFT_883324 [Trichophaea hybrida]
MATIVDGAMKFTLDNIKPLFDTQVKRILGLLDQQLQGLAIEHSEVQVFAIYLCGGLVKDHYSTSSDFQIREMMILGAELSEAQLAVCNGLVMGHVGQVKDDSDKPQGTRPVFRSTLSWGVVHNERYEKRHKGQYFKEIDGEKYETDRIDWYIYKGDRVEPQEYCHRFSRRYARRKPKPKWEDTIVITTYDRKDAPVFLWNRDVRVAYIVEAELPTILPDMNDVTTHKAWYKIWGGETTIFYDIFDLSDTAVEVWFEGEKRGSNAYKVVWKDESAGQALEKDPEETERPLTKRGQCHDQKGEGVPKAGKEGGIPKAGKAGPSGFVFSFMTPNLFTISSPSNLQSTYLLMSPSAKLAT